MSDSPELSRCVLVAMRDHLGGKDQIYVEVAVAAV